jgi:hypothetical protein
MTNYINSVFSYPLNIECRKTSHLFLQAFFTLMLFSSLLSAKTNGQSANLDQIRNGSATSPLPTADWVNGNAGPSNAHYAEGWSIPYRMVVTGLTNGVHTLVIEWDTKQSGGHAIDFVTRYDFLDNPTGSHQATFGHAPETINPLLGLSGNFSMSTTPFPAPGSVGSSRPGQPTNTFNTVASNCYMTIYNGTIASGGMTYEFEQAPSDANNTSSTRLKIVFTANASTVVFAWGGHIATQATWGEGQGATGVNGSPYHTRLISLDGSGGNQDRSLKASAVVIPPPTCGISAAQLACPATTSLTYNATGSSTGTDVSYIWTLTNGSPSAGAKISGSNTGYSIQVVPIGSAFTAGGTFSLSLQVNKTGATSTTCSRSPAGTIVDLRSSISKVDVTCEGDATGSINLTPTGGTTPYTFAWTKTGDPNFSASSEDLGNLSAGTYNVVITEASAGCTANNSATINDGTRPDAPSVCIVQPSLCDPLKTSFKISFTSPLATGNQYSIDNGANFLSTSVFCNVAAGSNPVMKVKNASGCISAATLCTSSNVSICNDDPVCPPPPTPTQSTTQSVTTQQIELAPQPKVTAAPNPYNDKVRFSVKSAISGQGTLELYNTLGQKLKTVFQGRVEAGQVQNFEYNVPNAHRSNLIYIFRVGDQKVTGRLIH